jgi:hypothetical protein
MGWTVYNSDGKILQSAELGDNAVTSAKIADGAILNADINASAAIAKTKLASLDVVNADINASAAVALTKLAATTVSRALVSDGSGVISPSAVTSTEIGYLDGVTSAIQTQITAKQATIDASARLDAASIGANGNVSNTEYGYLSGVTSDLQTQLNAAGGAVTRQGGNTSEVTTTSTSADNLLAIASLSIAATTPLVAHVLMRKTAGAANHPVWGYTVNATSIGAGMGMGSTSNEIQEGMKLVYMPARVATYTFAGPIVPGRASDQSGNNARTVIEAGSYGSGPMQAAFPTATVTDFKIDGKSQTGLTFGVDELHLYSWATS